MKCNCNHLTNFAVRRGNYFVSDEEIIPAEDPATQIADEEEEDDCTSYSTSISPILYIAFGLFVICHVAAAFYACKDSKKIAEVKYDLNNT